MKVLYILSSVSPFGGSSKSFLRLIKVLLRRENDLEVMVCAPSLGGILDELKDMERVRLEKIDLRFNVYPQLKTIKDYLLFLPKLLYHFLINSISYYKLLFLAKKYQPDVIHTNVGVVNIGYRVAKKLNIPHIYHLREYQDMHFGMKIIPSMQRFKKELKQDGNSNICITKGIREHFDLAEDKNTKVIYDPILPTDSIVFEKEKSKFFLFVGRLDAKKGIFEVLEAFASFYEKRKDYRLKCCGVPSDGNMELLYSEAERLGIKDVVDFLLMRDDVDVFMRKATMLIMGSEWEGFGLVTAEAMANGCLVVGKDNTGTKEQFDNGLNLTKEEIGLRYNSKDELVDIMHKVVDDGIESYFSMIERAQTTIKNFYTTEVVVNQVLDFYKSLCRK